MRLASDRALAAADPAQLVIWLAVLALNFLVLSLAFRFAAQRSTRAVQRSPFLAVWAPAAR